MNHDLEIERALQLVPDEPRWIEGRGILLSGHAEVCGDEDGLLIRNRREGSRLAVAWRRPPSLADSVARVEAEELLCAHEDAEWVAAQLGGWKCEGASLFRLDDAAVIEPLASKARLLSSEDELNDLEQELRDEIEEARAAGEVWCAEAEGRVASFAYSYWRTEGHFDISIDTPEAFRRRGLARIAVSGLIRAERERGLEPVWGAMDDNVASSELARTLGFVRHDAIAIFSRE